MSDWLVVLLSLPVSALLTWIIRGYARRRGLLDVPNHRSSHGTPTPRGGGLAIVFTFLAALLFFRLNQTVTPVLFNAVFYGGVLVAAIGFCDDHVNVAVRWRLLAHFLAVALALLCLGKIPPLQLGGFSWQPGLWGYLPAMVVLVWVLNFFNFMDGIDGIAAVEAISIAVGAALIMAWQHGMTPASLLLVCFAAAVLGFLFWNWPKAHIFMGDGGSGFLGYVLGVMAVYTAGQHMAIPVWSWFILSGVFTTDATVTLLRRMVNGERWYMAHRSHAYQKMARKWHSHARVTLAVLGINILWLFPLAFWAASSPPLAFILTLLAYTPLIIIVFRSGAGRPELQRADSNRIHN